MSDAEDWEELQRLFHLADATGEADRERVLMRECADPGLRRRVSELQAAADRIGGAGDRIAGARNPIGAVAAAPGRDPRHIGPYRLVRLLGSGGMGSVYEVERLLDGVAQRAALKVLAPHAAGPEFADRFQRERKILASLDHPAITRMLDAGVDAGQAYLCMEYVEGVHFDAYCDNGTLGIAERLQLFLKVCEAVAYAHRSLVVHLDLKPHNILVTAAKAVKLLDFGTSKLLGTHGDATYTISATPSYASPEQLRGEAVTTSCDVYSLGAILYELLSGRKPFGNASAAGGVERAVTQREPVGIEKVVEPQAAASRGLSDVRLRALLTGDLATIVRKSLASRPQDRYLSVSALADDVGRYLAGRPVLARRQTRVYRAAKFLARHRGAVAASLLAALALAVSFGYAWRGEVHAFKEGQRALRMQTFLYRLFEIANSNYTGKPAASIKDFLQLGVKTLPQYVRDPADLRQAELALAQSMYWNHDYDAAAPIYTGIADAAKAQGDVAAEAEADSYLAYLAVRKGAADEAYARSARALELTQTHALTPQVQVLSRLNYALVREQTGQASDANLALLDSAVRTAREARLPPHLIGELFYFWGSIVLTRGRMDEAEQHFHEALTAYRDDPLAVCAESTVYAGLGNVLTYQNRHAESIGFFKSAYDRSKTCNGADDTQTLRFLAPWAGALIKAGRQAEGIAMLEAALPAWNQKIPRSSPYTIEILQPLGRGYIETGRFAEAGRIADAMLDSVNQAHMAPRHKYFGYARLMRAQALAGQGHYPEALPDAEMADSILAAFANTPAGRLNSDRAHVLLEDIRQRMPP